MKRPATNRPTKLAASQVLRRGFVQGRSAIHAHRFEQACTHETHSMHRHSLEGVALAKTHALVHSLGGRSRDPCAKTLWLGVSRSGVVVSVSGQACCCLSNAGQTRGMSVGCNWGSKVCTTG